MKTKINKEELVSHPKSIYCEHVWVREGADKHTEDIIFYCNKCLEIRRVPIHTRVKISLPITLLAAAIICAAGLFIYLGGI
jgi:hypothetical protein